MGWFDDLADKVGFSSRALGVNTAEDKAARAKAAQDAEDAAYYDQDLQRVSQERAAAQAEERANRNSQLDDAYYKQKYGVNAEYIKNLDTPPALRKQQGSVQGMGDLKQLDQRSADQMNRVANSGWDQGAFDRGEAMGGWTPAEGMIQKPDDRAWYEKSLDWMKENPNATALGAQALTGGLGYLATKGDYEKAQKTLEDAASMAGTYRDLGVSQASQIAENPELAGMQMGVLKKLQGVSEAGQTAEDEAYRRQQQNAVNKQFQARQAQIGEEMARRGAQAGSGMGLAASIGGNATALQQASEASDADMIRKQQARMGALRDISSQSAAMQQNEFNRNLQRASAADRFNEVNAQNLMAAKQKQAGAMGSVAQAQAQKGQRTGELIGSLGQAAQTAIPGSVAQKKAQNSSSGVVGDVLNFVNKFKG